MRRGNLEIEFKFTCIHLCHIYPGNKPTRTDLSVCSYFMIAIVLIPLVPVLMALIMALALILGLIFVLVGSCLCSPEENDSTGPPIPILLPSDLPNVRKIADWLEE